MRLRKVTNAERRPSKATGRVFPWISSIVDGEELPLAIDVDSPRDVEIFKSFGDFVEPARGERMVRLGKGEVVTA